MAWAWATTTPGPDRAATRSAGQQASAYTGMVIKRDPGQGTIWIAYLSLISGLVLSFYFPRRRVWARLADGRLEVAHGGRPLRRTPNASSGGLLDELVGPTT